MSLRFQLAIVVVVVVVRVACKFDRTYLPDLSVQPATSLRALILIPALMLAAFVIVVVVVVVVVLC